MENIQIFKNNNFGEIRTINITDKPYICLADVCKILEIKNTSQLKTRLKKDGVITNEVIDKLGRQQKATFINESNLYKVIFQSRKPEAEQFTEWVTSEVLPAIRKTGGYIAGEENMTDEQLIAKAFTVINKKLELANKQIEEQKPKVLFADSVSTSNDTILIRDMAKLLNQNNINIGQNRLYEWLRNNGYLIKSQFEDRNSPTQKAMNMKLFEVKETTINTPAGAKINRVTKVTGKGQVYFMNKFKQLKEIQEQQKQELVCPFD